MTTSPTTRENNEATAAIKALVGAGEHWFEMTATLSPAATESFSDWMDHQLALVDQELADYASPTSLNKAVRS